MVAPYSTDNFLVSVIIPTYNRLPFLVPALNSVLEQTCRIHEIIVVDDGSTDGTVEFLHKNFPAVSVISQKNQGVSSARNTGIRKATGEWIALLDSDDLWLPEKIEKQVHFLSRNKSYQACQTLEKWIRNGNHVIPPKYLDKSENGLFQRSLQRCIICPSSVLLHSTIFKEIGLFDESLPLCEDYDFWIRLLLKNKIGLLEELLVIKNGGHDDQLSMSTWGLDRYRIQSLEKIVTAEILDQVQEKMILETLIKKIHLSIQGFQKHNKMGESENYMKKKDKALDRLVSLQIQNE